MEYKKVSFNITECKQTDENGNKIGTIKGFASTFGNIDRTNDIIDKGAFDKTIHVFKESGRPIRMLFNHKNQDFPIGGFPPNLITITEKGLEVVGKVDTNTSRGHDAFSLAKNGFLSDFSIGFSIPAGKTEIKDGNRIIKEIDLWEISLVSEPANTEAQVTQVKAVVPFQDLPIAKNSDGTPSTMKWDGSEALKRILKFTADDGGQNFDEFKKAFFWFNSEHPNLIGSYKLPFADIVNNKMIAIPRGIFAVAGALRGARGGLNIPDSDMKRVESNVSKYYDKMNLSDPFSKTFSCVDEIEDLRHIEEFLSNPYPLSRKDRKTFISCIKKYSQRDAEEISTDSFNQRDAEDKIDRFLYVSKINKIINLTRS